MTAGLFRSGTRPPESTLPRDKETEASMVFVSDSMEYDA
jgi:hypothetical protein